MSGGITATAITVTGVALTPADVVAGVRETGSFARLSRTALSGQGTLHAFDIELLHLHHGLKGSPGFCGVGVAHQLGQHFGDDLPGKAVLIF
jgi:hypothetical protein